jgi:phosphate transport system ATP-binding protein
MVASANTRLRLETAKLTALFGSFRAVRDVSLLFPAHTVTAIIGPSGCGKSTLLRCLNRMHELSPGAVVTGEVLLDEMNIYGAGVNPVELRRRIGMVFQRPTPFPTMSIYDNVAAGLRVNGRGPRREMDASVERALRQAALWDEVKDRLRTSALALSGGQQQPAIARAVAHTTGNPAARRADRVLDPAGTQRIESCATRSSGSYTIVI